MPARVHHWNGGTRCVLERGGARIGQPGGLLDGERVQLCPEQEGRSLSVSQHADDAVAPDVLGDFKAKGLEPCRELGCRFLLVERQLGILVQLLVQGIK